MKKRPHYRHHHYQEQQQRWYIHFKARDFLPLDCPGHGLLASAVFSLLVPFFIPAFNPSLGLLRFKLKYPEQM